MTMDVNDLRILITAVSFLVFVGIVFWAFSGKQRKGFDEAAQLPFAEPDTPATPAVDIGADQRRSGGERK